MLPPVQPGHWGVLLTTATGRARRAGNEAIETLTELFEQSKDFRGPMDDNFSGNQVLTGVSSEVHQPARTDSSWTDSRLPVASMELFEACDTGVRNTIFLRFSSKQVPEPALQVQKLFELTRKRGYIDTPACESFFPVEIVCKAYPRHVKMAFTDPIRRWLQTPAAGETTKPLSYAIRFRARNNDRAHARDFIETIGEIVAPLMEQRMLRVDLEEPDVTVFVHVLGKLCYLGAVPRDLVRLSSPRLNIHACITQIGKQDKRPIETSRFHIDDDLARTRPEKRFRTLANAITDESRVFKPAGDSVEHT